MKRLPLLTLVCLYVLIFATPVQARHKHPADPPPAAALATPASEPGPLPAEAAPKISSDAPPSVSLQPFLDIHLGQILAPLGTSAFAQPEVIASLKASYADGLAAAPVGHQPAYQLALAVCEALTGAMTERQNAVAALRGALATRSSEAEQPRGGGQAVATARDKDAFFTDSQKNTWMQRAGVLREKITALYLRERATERQIGAWYPPASYPLPAGATATPAVSMAAAVNAEATPSVSAPAAAPPAAGQDPALGVWMWQGYEVVNVKPDSTVDGSRHGYWYFVSNLSQGRYYEFHWQKHDAVDYVVLSPDGKKLEGKNKDEKYVYAERK